MEILSGFSHHCNMFLNYECIEKWNTNQWTLKIPKPPFPMGYQNPHLIYSSFGQLTHHPKHQFDCFTRFYTPEPQIPHSFNGQPHIHPKHGLFPWGDMDLPSNTWFSGPNRYIISNGFSIELARSLPADKQNEIVHKIWCESKGHFCHYTVINDKNCSLSVVLTTMDQKLQKTQLSRLVMRRGMYTV